MNLELHNTICFKSKLGDVGANLASATMSKWSGFKSVVFNAVKIEFSPRSFNNRSFLIIQVPVEISTPQRGLP